MVGYPAATADRAPFTESSTATASAGPPERAAGVHVHGRLRLAGRFGQRVLGAEPAVGVEQGGEAGHLKTGGQPLLHRRPHRWQDVVGDLLEPRGDSHDRWSAIQGLASRLSSVAW
jgi:hypothetical protein